MKYQLTELEKRVLKGAIDEGYFWDDLDGNFICWGFEGKQERGAAASLVKKGLIEVVEDDGDVMVFAKIDKREMLDLLGIEHN